MQRRVQACSSRFVLLFFTGYSTFINDIRSILMERDIITVRMHRAFHVFPIFSDVFFYFLLFLQEKQLILRDCSFQARLETRFLDVTTYFFRKHSLLFVFLGSKEPPKSAPNSKISKRRENKSLLHLRTPHFRRTSRDELQTYVLEVLQETIS